MSALQVTVPYPRGNMPDVASLIQQAEAKFSLPPGLLAAHRQVESSNGRNLHSGQADGSMQITPANAKAWGIDPMDDAQAIPAAAKLIRGNIDASGGDIDKATMMYFGGPNERNWGPKTRAYPGKILAALGPSDAPAQPASNAFLDHVSGKTAAATADTGGDNAFLRHVSGANAAGDASQNPRRNLGAASPSAGLGFAGGTSSGALGPQSNGIAATGDGAPVGQQGGSGAPNSAGGGPGISGQAVAGSNSPATEKASLLARFLQGGADLATGTAQGVVTGIGGGGAELLGRGTDALGLTHGQADRVAELRKQVDQSFDSHKYDPTGAAQTVGNISGQVLATLPLGGVGLISKAAPVAKAASAIASATAAGTKASMLARTLNAGARIGDAAIGGAAGNMIAGAPNSDVAGNATLGGAIGAGIGVVSPLAGRIATPIIDAVAPRAKALAAGLRGAAPVAEDAAGNAAQQVAPSPQELAAAISTGGTRRGLISNTSLPDSVASKAHELIAQGVPAAHAMREAEMLHIGAKPTLSDTTHNFSEQQATKEGAKLATPEGVRLMETQVANNAAAHNAVKNLVESYGGSPAHGEAMQTAAKTLAAASDAAQGKVSELYKVAEQADGALTVHPDPLRETLASMDFNAPKTAAGNAFAEGMRKDLATLTSDVKGGARGLGATELERLRQRANAAYDPSGSAEVNSMIGKVKAAIDTSFDELGDSSAAYKTARKAHKAWADAYDVPGIADLTRRDAAGEFTGAWRKLDRGLANGMDDRPFVAMVNRLKANGNEDAIDKLKASIIQDAYEKVTAGARDAGDHAPLNGRLFMAQLDKLGAAKLEALFGKTESGNLAAIGRAAMHLNDAVPGAVNHSNTTSAAHNSLIKAMSDAKGDSSGGKTAAIHAVIGTAAQALGQIVAPGVGGVAMGAAANGVKMAADAVGKRRAATALAEALRGVTSPETARAAATARQAALARNLRANDNGRRIARIAAPAGAAAGGKH